jgi:predicted ribosome-associated RNA-binding protein Tma20
VSTAKNYLGNTVDLVKILEKNQKFHTYIIAVTLKVMSWRTMSKKKRWKKVKNQDFMGKTNYVLRTLPFSPGQFQPHGCM